LVSVITAVAIGESGERKGKAEKYAGKEALAYVKT
jgi:hypothetical protein